MKKLNIIFMGTPDFAVSSLKVLVHHQLVNLKAVVSMPDRPSGRGQNLQSPPVAQFANENSIPLIQTENVNKSTHALELFENADVIIVLAFAQFLGSKILAAPKLGCFNIHTSLLPKYRGAAPIQHALLNGDSSTGVSIQKMVKKMDAGDLVFEQVVPIDPDEKGGSLYAKLKERAGLCLDQFLVNLVEGKVIETPQDESQVSFAPTIKKKDGHLHFADISATDCINKFRAFDPWPGVFGFFGKKRVKYLDLNISNIPVPPGIVEVHDQKLIVGCKLGSIQINTIQLEGKRPSTAADFLNSIQVESLIFE